MVRLKWLVLVSCGLIGGPLLAQAVPESPPVAAEKEVPVVEGATADRVARIEQCQGHKFDTVVQTDPTQSRGMRVKLCADPGASDADWVKTLEAAIVQLQARDMPAAAKDKVIGELRQEIAKYTAVAVPGIAKPAGPTFTTDLGGLGLPQGPAERFETSVLPPLPPPLARKPVQLAGGASSAVVASAPPPPTMRFRIKCLSQGESGAGSTCDYFDSRTMISLSAVEGMEKGATLRFLRRGEASGEVELAPLAAGKATRVRLPRELCRGVAFTKVELELLAPGSSRSASARVGPYEMKC